MPAPGQAAARAGPGDDPCRARWPAEVVISIRLDHSLLPKGMFLGRVLLPGANLIGLGQSKHPAKVPSGSGMLSVRASLGSAQAQGPKSQRWPGHTAATSPIELGPSPRPKATEMVRPTLTCWLHSRNRVCSRMIVHKVTIYSLQRNNSSRLFTRLAPTVNDWLALFLSSI